MVSTDIAAITVRSPDEQKQAARDAVVAMRDAIAAELRERWPALATEMIALLAREKGVDDDIRALNNALSPDLKIDLTEPAWRHEPERAGESIHRVPAYQPKPLYLSTEIPALRPGDSSHLIPWNHRE